MSPYQNLMIAAAVFVLSHAGLATGPMRRALVARLGQGWYLGLYSLVAMGTFAWLLMAYAAAPRDYLWLAPAWVRFLPVVVMTFAAILVVCGYTGANPTAVGLDRLTRLEQGPRGIFRVTRHPVMSAILLWAAVHIPASGQASGIILQASIGILAMLGMVSIDRRKSAEMGDAWRDYAARSSALPFAAILRGRQHFVFSEIGWVRVIAGLTLYGALLIAHPFIIGVSPLPTGL